MMFAESYYNFNANDQKMTIDQLVRRDFALNTETGMTCGDKMSTAKDINFIEVLALPQYKEKAKEMQTKFIKISDEVKKLETLINNQCRVVADKKTLLNEAEKKKASFGEIAARIFGGICLGLVYTALVVSLVGLPLMASIELEIRPMERLINGKEVFTAKIELQAASSSLRRLENKLKLDKLRLKEGEEGIKAMENVVFSTTKNAENLLQFLDGSEDENCYIEAIEIVKNCLGSE